MFLNSLPSLPSEHTGSCNCGHCCLHSDSDRDSTSKFCAANARTSCFVVDLHGPMLAAPLHSASHKLLYISLVSRLHTGWNTLKHMHSSSTVPRSSLALMADPSEICVISTAPSKVRGRSCTTAASWLHVTGHASLNEALSHVPCVAYIVHSSFCLSQDHGQMFLKSSKDSHACAVAKPGHSTLESFMLSGTTSPAWSKSRNMRTACTLSDTSETRPSELSARSSPAPISMSSRTSLASMPEMSVDSKASRAFASESSLGPSIAFTSGSHVL
mmetsp:Transcript_9347/g.23992  ORF Transcript_9347/g.23992 Transcript_9347/m.23992 type:complete len:272 (+) Transcript_9347:61-876(+)